MKAKREAAARARRLALQLTSEADRMRALAFAAELDAEADAMERAIVPSAAPRVTQIQMQVQQGPPALAQDQDGKKHDDSKDEVSKDEGSKDKS